MDRVSADVRSQAVECDVQSASPRLGVVESDIQLGQGRMICIEESPRERGRAPVKSM